MIEVPEGYYFEINETYDICGYHYFLKLKRVRRILRDKVLEARSINSLKDFEFRGVGYSYDEYLFDLSYRMWNTYHTWDTMTKYIGKYPPKKLGV